MPKHSERSSMQNTCSSAEVNSHCKKQFEHKIQLQLSDSLGFPVPGTEFWVTLLIVKNGNKVTIQLPVINFQTGPSANNPAEPPPLVQGGYVYTSDGFLPKDVRPNDLVNRSLLVPSNNGMSLPFSFTQTPSSLPVPPVGYILQITNAGALVIQCAGTFGNIIPPGPQILMPTDITYIAKPKIRLSKNYIVDSGFNNITQFTGRALDDANRDAHPNDVFDGVTAWSWTSNANLPDKTNNTVNTFVSIGKIKNGKLKIKQPVQLTNLPVNLMAWDAGVAISRTNKKNIIVSYSVINHTPGLNPPYGTGVPCRAVSFDGGKTWPAVYDGVTSQPLNGPINIIPTGVPSSSGDCRGVGSDKFGNIWYSTTNFFDNFGNLLNQPFFGASFDGGVSYSLIYTVPANTIPPNTYTDYPQFCFGGDGQGGYGMYFLATPINEITGDESTSVGFIPINGFGLSNIDTANISYVPLQSISNNCMIEADIVASADGRVWLQGYVNSYGAASYICPQVLSFKSPGQPLNSNWAGSWQYLIMNNYSYNYDNPSLQDSQPYDGYGDGAPPTSIIYDDKRQALYAISQGNFPDNSQNMRIYFIISRDNGQTWSQAIDINSSDFANRGFQSMALDPVTGDLIFGWYDGRNDPTYQGLQYFAAIIPAKKLDKLVNKIPLSNPLYTIPAVDV